MLCRVHGDDGARLATGRPRREAVDAQVGPHGLIQGLHVGKRRLGQQAAQGFKLVGRCLRRLAGSPPVVHQLQPAVQTHRQDVVTAVKAAALFVD